MIYFEASEETEPNRAEPSRINHFQFEIPNVCTARPSIYTPNKHPPFSLSHTHLSLSLSLSSPSISDPPLMAESHRNRPSRRQPSRLQSRAPSSLQINRAVDWNVAIPLLSPLASSPPPPPPPQKEEPPQQRQPEKVVFKKWQHPAAPFCYEPASVVPPFVNV
ncbi:putative protein, chloroplastic, partial [Mucuna pruriens]